MSIEAKQLERTYRSGAVTLTVLGGISFTVPQGEFVAITGPSGAGKSTLLHLLAGLDHPTRGEVRWEGASLSRMNDRELAQWRNGTVGFVFQFYHLLPELSALENVLLPMLVGRTGGGRRALKDRALRCLEQVGLGARAGHRPRQLSGGELQRVAIARALINEPKILFCDEPTGNLDSQTGQQVAQLLIDAHRRNRMSIILVTHENALAQLADRWLVLRDGRVVSETRPAEQRSEAKGSHP